MLSLGSAFSRTGKTWSQRPECFEKKQSTNRERQWGMSKYRFKVHGGSYSKGDGSYSDFFGVLRMPGFSWDKRPEDIASVEALATTTPQVTAVAAAAGSWWGGSSAAAAAVSISSGEIVFQVVFKDGNSFIATGDATCFATLRSLVKHEMKSIPLEEKKSIPLKE
jgi:hypothetical protein